MIISFTGHRNAAVDPKALDLIATDYPGAIWCHGGARGVDQAVGDYCRAHQIPQIVLRPDYQAAGRGAPLIRNRQLVDQCDLLVAVYDNRPTGGTAYTVAYARRQSKPIRLITPGKAQPTMAEQDPPPAWSTDTATQSGG